MDPGPSSLSGVSLCLLILAMTSAVDTAFTSVSWRHLNTILAERAEHSPMLARLLNDPYSLKATIILLNTSATIAAAALTLQLTHESGIWIQIGALVALMLAILVVSAALPKALAGRDPQSAVRLLAGPVSFIAWLLWPLIAAVTLLLRPLGMLMGSQTMTRTPLVFEEELRLLVHAGEEEGFFEQEEREMIEGVFTFSDTIVREVMVPRVDVIAIERDTPLEEALDVVIREGHSRIPVYKETIDTIVGFLYAKDLLPALRSNRPDTTIAQLMRPVHYVPETVTVDILLRDLRKSKVHMAIVVDEYGGTAGLVTIEDLLEEIVGEIQDEYDTEDPAIQIVSETEVIVNARTLIEDFNAETGHKLEATKSDRVGGLVYEKLGRMPRVGDIVVLEDATVQVLSVAGLSADKLRITFQQPPEDETPTARHASRNGSDELLVRLLVSDHFNTQTVGGQHNGTV